KSGEPCLLAIPAHEVKVEKIDDVAAEQPVSEIPQDAAKDETQGNLSAQSVDIEMVASQNEDHQGGEGHAGQNRVIAAKEAPGCPRIVPMDEPEEATDKVFLLRADVLEYKQLG